MRGRRLFAAAGQGVDRATGLELTPGWDRVAGRRPLGAPAGLAGAADGALWGADDRNGAIIRLARDAP